MSHEVGLAVELSLKQKEELLSSSRPQCKVFTHGDPYLKLLSYNQKNFFIKTCPFPCKFKDLELAQLNFLSLYQQIFPNLSLSSNSLFLYEAFYSENALVLFRSITK